MSEHVRRTANNENKTHRYLRKNTQNEVINLVSHKIKFQIISSIQYAKYYSIIFVCTPDVSKVEQITIVIRYISINKINVQTKVEIFESFMPVEKATGLRLCDTSLIKLKLPLENMCGQGYDNGSNMRSLRAGVQSRIRNLDSRTFFVPCSSHSFSLKRRRIF